MFLFREALRDAFFKLHIALVQMSYFSAIFQFVSHSSLWTNDIIAVKPVTHCRHSKPPKHVALLRSPHDDRVVVAPRLVSVFCCKDLSCRWAQTTKEECFASFTPAHTHTHRLLSPWSGQCPFTPDVPGEHFSCLSHIHIQNSERAWGSREGRGGGGREASINLHLLSHSSP